MTIRELITTGRARSAGAWRIERDGSVATLVHHSTPMLCWDIHSPRERHTVLSIGWGSVSDQNGMNTAFRALDIPLRYDRDQRGGGPRVSDLCACDARPYSHDPAVCAA